MLKYSPGIDVSADSLACCLASIDRQQQVQVITTKSVANSPAGFKLLIRWTGKHHHQPELPLVCLLKATGVYYENCALALSKAGMYVSVILPNKSKKYMESPGLKSKNDKIDAKGKQKSPRKGIRVIGGLIFSGHHHGELPGHTVA